MALRFELKERDGLGRICELTTSHGKVLTPTLLPVINPNMVSISPGRMRGEFGAQMIITNSYIIGRTEGLREKALEEGVHSLLDFDGPIMTDSGAFQAYVYGDKPTEGGGVRGRPSGDGGFQGEDGLEVSPREIVEFQRDIGVDVGTILDVITETGATRSEAGKDVATTLDRARKAIPLKGEMSLAGTIQGSIFPDLREEHARAMGCLDLDLHPIGGVVPLMENYRYGDLARAIIGAKKGLPPGRPVHLFGAGHPHILAIAVLLGCDLFDSASYMKYAVNGRMMFEDGTRHLEEMEHLPCHCPVCSNVDVDTLGEMPAPERSVLLGRHNLHVLFGKLRAVRQAIHEGRLWEMAERDARAHPDLLGVLKVFGEETGFMERFEPLSRRSAFLHTGPESRFRPVVGRYRERLLDRYVLPKARAYFVLPDATKPYHRTYSDLVRLMAERGFHFTVESYFGPVPMELDMMYPLAQSLAGHTTEEERREILELWGRLEERNGITFEPWDREQIEMEHPGPERELDLDVLRVKAVATMQFGRRAAGALTDGKIELVRSPSGMIRNVHVDGEHVLSMRAHDGLYALKLAGARRILASVDPPTLRIVADGDAAPFVAEGKNLFARFVMDCDPVLRPGDDAPIVDPDGELLGVGRLLLNWEEMRSFGYGIAARTREHI